VFSISSWSICFHTFNKGIGWRWIPELVLTLCLGENPLAGAENRYMIPQICRPQFRVPYRLLLTKYERVEKTRQNLRIIFLFQKPVFQFQRTNLAFSMYCTMCCVRVCVRKLTTSAFVSWSLIYILLYDYIIRSQSVAERRRKI